MALTFTRKTGPSVSLQPGGGTDESVPNVSAYGTTAEWVAAGHVLGHGEIGWDTTTGALAVGDGVSLFAGLASIGTGLGGATVLLIDTVEDLPPGTAAGVVVVVKS
jgi:hypothetical protein